MDTFKPMDKTKEKTHSLDHIAADLIWNQINAIRFA